jgi:O-antigen ligase
MRIASLTHNTFDTLKENYINGNGIFYFMLTALLTCILLAMRMILPANPNFLFVLPIYLISTVLVIMKPEIVIIILVIFTSTVFSIDAFPQPVSSGQIGLYIPEVILVLLVIRTFFVALKKRDVRRMASYGTLPMVLFSVWFVFSLLKALLIEKTPLLDAVLIGRTYIYYGNFFLVLYYINTKEKFHLLFKSLLIIAGVCTILSFVQYVLGPDNKIFPWHAWTVYRISYAQGETTLARVMPVSISLIYLFLFPVLVGTINGAFRKKIWPKVFIIVAVLSLFLSFTRNVYYSLFLGIFLVWLKFRGAIKLQMTRKIITVVLIVVLIAYLPVFFGAIKVTDWWDQVIGRHQEVFVEGAYTQTLAWRAIEANAIFSRVMENPILGNGIGAQYYHPMYKSYVYVAHNGFFTILFQMGLIGLAIFGLVFYRFIAASLRIYKKTKNLCYRSVLLGFLVAFVALLPAVWVKPVFVQEVFWISLLSIIWAVPYVIERLQQKEESVANDASVEKNSRVDTPDLRRFVGNCKK